MGGELAIDAGRRGGLTSAPKSSRRLPWALPSSSVPSLPLRHSSIELRIRKNHVQPGLLRGPRSMANTTDRLYRMPIGDFSAAGPRRKHARHAGRHFPTVRCSVHPAECGPTIRRPSLFTSSTARQASSTIGSCASARGRARAGPPLPTQPRRPSHRGQRIVAPRRGIEDDGRGAGRHRARRRHTGVLGRTPPQLLAILPDTTWRAPLTPPTASWWPSTTRSSLRARRRRSAWSVFVWQRVRAGAVIESASRSLRSGRPEMMGKPA